MMMTPSREFEKLQLGVDAQTNHPVDILVTASTVIEARNLPIIHRLRDPSYYIALTADEKEFKTKTISGRVPKWNESFTIPAHLHSRLQLRLYRVHTFLPGEPRIIARTKDSVILESARNQDITLDLHEPDGNDPSRVRGLAIIRLEVDLSVSDALWKTSVVYGPRTMQDLLRTGLVTGILPADFHRIGPQWCSLLTSLLSLVNFTGTLAKFNPEVKVALVVVSCALEIVIGQIERDRKIELLVGTMASMYGFLEDANPLRKIRSYERTVQRLVRQTTECAHFIAEYSKTSAFARRAVSNLVSNADTLIAAYAASFGELKIEFIMGATLQTALTTVRILEKVEDISNLLNLTTLPYMQNASWDPCRTCLPGTNISIIDDIIRWLPGTNSARDERIYLLLGRPRCGKSSVSNTIAQILRTGRRLGAAIFLARNIEDRNSAQKLFSSIARELAAFDGKIKERIARVIEGDPSLPSAAIERQFQDLLVVPMRGLTIIGPVVIIIDGLDECKDRGRLLRILATQCVHLPSNFRFLITARPEPDIEVAFQGGVYHTRREFCLDESDIEDTSAYFVGALSELATARPTVLGEYTVDTLREQLVKRAMEIQFWALTACKFLLGTTDHEAASFLENLLSYPFPETAEATIDQVFTAILEAIFTESSSESDGWQSLFRALIQGQLPPSISAPHALKLLSIASGRQPIDALITAGCMLTKADSNDSLALMLHPGFEAFITDRHRCTDDRFYVNTSVTWDAVAEVCLLIMNHLSHNMCRIWYAALPKLELTEGERHIQQFVGGPLRYASQQWVEFIVNTRHDTKRVFEQLHLFLFEHLLHWIELSILMGLLDSTLSSLKDLVGWLKKQAVHESNLIAMTLDGIQFIHTFSAVISASGQHTYISALLPFAPLDTLFYYTYMSESIIERPWVLSQEDEVWSCSQRLEGHTGPVNSVTFSPDGSKIVSSSKDKTVRIWDARQGVAHGGPLCGHTGTVFCAEMSPEGSRIASCSWDQSVRVWNAHAGHLVKTLQGHKGTVCSVAYSPDGSRIVSCSEDGEIRIWDANTGTAMGNPLVGHTDEVRCVSYSPNGKFVASGSCDKTVRIWDAQDRRILGGPLRGHLDRVYSVAWSPNGVLLASGSTDRSVCIWHAHSRHAIFELQGHENDVTSVVFSPDGSKLASASWDETIRLWDVYSGQCVGKPLRGHNNVIQSLAFSPDGQLLASGSRDNTVRIWTKKRPRKLSFTPRPEPFNVATSEPSSSTIDTRDAVDYSSHVDGDGWIRTTKGARVLWVPIPGGTVSVGSDCLIVEG